MLRGIATLGLCFAASCAPSNGPATEGATKDASGPAVDAAEGASGARDAVGEARDVADPEVLDAEPEHPFEGVLSPVERGEYLVRHVLGCVECHSPRGSDGKFLEEQLLSGSENLVDLDPVDDSIGAIHAPNLTPHATAGLGDWTDRQIKDAIRSGIAPVNEPLHPTMPYWVFRNLPEAEADDVVAYLRSITPVDRVIPERQPLPVPLDAPARPVPEEAIPETALSPDDPAYDRAQRGRYLAGLACMRCHSPESAPGSPIPVDIERLFTGRQRMAPFPANAVPEGAPLIESKNLTPHESGIAEYAPEGIRRALKIGQNRLGLSICPPMPVGPFGSFALLTDDDALDIGLYLTTLEPQDSGPIEDCCRACHGEMGEVTEPGLNPLGASFGARPPAAVTAGFHDGPVSCATSAYR